ncbi:inter-alpha-trypsin inhibitor heavy chain H3 [Gracilinanus agilis]|uniref:inter-alpha-trypsin inhibitor heavy chain H3 n=1 Tax=Gracilinanus agilis TaxID=191870 RepID=UPI001CFF0053|nr:inter-alpha-trypsin inhibitor heavy chain H3 [Gracilinanus agilis]
MALVLRLCVFLILLSGLGTSHFLINPLRNLRKRSLPDTIVDGIEIYSTKINCKVTSRFAHNVVTTRAVNRADTAKEVFFDVELPKTAFITNFTLTIDGVTYPGNVKEKEVAKKQYEKAVSQGKTAGLVNLQTKEALFQILSDMKKDDSLNFILFSSDVSTWKENLVPATPENLKAAKEFVHNIQATGATNINDGLLRGIEMVNKAREMGIVLDRSTSIIIMLTDGEANVGESRVEKIQENVRNAIGGKYPLYNLGFGHDVNYNFLEKMALENNGVARRIYEDSDANLQMQGFYDEVANPLLIDVNLQYPQNAISDVTQNNYQHFYDGSEIVVAGKLVDFETNSFVADVKGHGALNDLTFTEEVDLKEMEKALQEQEYIFGDYIERLWAYLTIEQLLEKRKNAQGEEKENLTAQALELSLKYHFVTPLTSMVVTKPEDNEESEAIADKPGEEVKADHIMQTYATQVNYQPPSTPYYFVDGDPHFIIEVPQKDDALCFNIDEEPGVVLNLIQDPDTGITVNGEIIGEKKASSETTKRKSYFGKLGIIDPQMDLKIEVTTQKITLWSGGRRNSFSWMDTVTITQNGLSVAINRKKNMVVSIGDGVTFVIVLHPVWKKQDFLGLYTVDSHRMSTRTHGLLGQFFHPFDFEVFDVRAGSDPKKPDATMIVKNNKLTVTRGSQRDYRKDSGHGSKVFCWFVHDNGSGLIDGVHTDYIVPDLFYSSPTHF